MARRVELMTNTPDKSKDRIEVIYSEPVKSPTKEEILERNAKMEEERFQMRKKHEFEKVFGSFCGFS